MESYNKFLSSPPAMAAIDQERGEKATAHRSASTQRRVERRVLAVECFQRLQKLSSEKQEKDNRRLKIDFFSTRTSMRGREGGRGGREGGRVRRGREGVRDRWGREGGRESEAGEGGRGGRVRREGG